MITKKIIMEKMIEKLMRKTSNNKLYAEYKSIKEMCNNPTNPLYRNYGGIGIQCLFQNYEEFVLLAIKNGYDVHKNISIERIDINGHYEPSNIVFLDLNIGQNYNQKIQTIKKNYKGVKLLECGRYYSVTVGGYYLGYVSSVIDGAIMRDMYIIFNNLLDEYELQIIQIDCYGNLIIK